MNAWQNCLIMGPQYFSGGYATFSALTAGDMLVDLSSESVVGTLQGQWPPLWAAFLTALATLLHLQVTIYHKPVAVNQGTEGRESTELKFRKACSMNSNNFQMCQLLLLFGDRHVSSHLGWGAHWPWHTNIWTLLVQLSIVMVILYTFGAQRLEVCLPGVRGN